MIQVVKDQLEELKPLAEDLKEELARADALLAGKPVFQNTQRM
jgi:hypothetical protein